MGLITLIKNIKYLSKYNLKKLNKKVDDSFFRYYDIMKIIYQSYSMPKIRSFDDTVNYLINNNVSLSRFGDGEYNLIHNKSIPFQKSSEALSERLKEVLTSNREDITIGIPKLYFDFSITGLNKVVENFLISYVSNNYKTLHNYVNSDVVYSCTEITQLYQIFENYDFDKYFESIKQIWKNKDIAIICGEQIFNNLENNIFDCAKSVEYQYAPSKDAFETYDEILSNAKLIDMHKLVIIILGPTATVLAYDLAKSGYRALDFGHIAKDYDAYIRKNSRNKEDLVKFLAPD